MTVTVLLFASYAERIGTSRLDMAVADGATVGDVVREVGRLPGAGMLPPSPLVAVNRAYASAATPLAPGDEVAIIPPVAGG